MFEMVTPNYGLNFGDMTPIKIAVRLSYEQVKIALWIATGVPRNERSQQLANEIGNLEGALVLCAGEFIPGARNIQ